MDLNSGIGRVSAELALIPWETWHPPLGKFLKRPAFMGMGDIPDRYSQGAFIVFMAIVGLNDYRIRNRAEVGYWPNIWRQAKEKPAPTNPSELASIMKSFYGGEPAWKPRENAWKQKVSRVHRFLGSPLAAELWDMEPQQVAKNLPELWVRIAATMEQRCQDKTIAFASRTIGTALRILAIDNFNYEGIPIPVDSRLHQLTPHLLADEVVRTFWEYVLVNVQKTEPRVTMFHLDSFLWSFAGEKNKANKVAWLISQGIDEATSKEIVCVFEEITNVRVS